MTNKIKIKLDKEYYATVPLTLGQLEDLNVAVVMEAADDPAEEVKRNFSRNIGIIIAGIGLENPDITVASLRAMRVTSADFSKAVSAILDASGLIQKRDGAEGEAQAETAKAA